MNSVEAANAASDIMVGYLMWIFCSLSCLIILTRNLAFRGKFGTFDLVLIPWVTRSR